MFRFTIRDLLWLMVVVGLIAGWTLDHIRGWNSLLRTQEAVYQVAKEWATEVMHEVEFAIPGTGSKHTAIPN